jgi:ABC-type nitrate/sulfonate/bicarbonate transport system permease component
MHWQRWLRKDPSGILLLVGLLLLWEWLARAGLVYTVYMPPISHILATLINLGASGSLLAALAVSLVRGAVGYGLAILLAVPLGVVIGFYRQAFHLFEPLIELLRPMPPPAIIPMAILFLGIGNEMKVFIIAFACFFPILVNTAHGVRSVEPVLLATAKTFGLSDGQILRAVVVPSAMPAIAAGLRISLAIALILVVISEMVAGNNGIGFLILDAQRAFRVSEMYAGIFALAILGYILNRLFVCVESRVLAWYRGVTVWGRQ